jgi:hypothetical protein
LFEFRYTHLDVSFKSLQEEHGKAKLELQSVSE